MTIMKDIVNMEQKQIKKKIEDLRKIMKTMNSQHVKEMKFIKQFQTDIQIKTSTESICSRINQYEDRISALLGFLVTKYEKKDFKKSKET